MTEPVTLAVGGATGRMGRRIVALLSADPALRLVAAVGGPGDPALGTDAGRLAGVRDLRVPVTERASGAFQVLIDFSAPEALEARIDDALRAKAGIVVGTTGLTEAHLSRLREASARIPVLQTPNTSVGVNLLFSIVREVSAVLGSGFDVEIIESHHRHKKDAPSGTALRLAREVAGGRGDASARGMVHGRQGQVGERPEGQIGIHAVRAGDIVGEHTVLFAGEGERLEITHRAHSRDTFALGALRAARFLAGKPAGSYSIGQALGLERIT